ncbi:MAG TPA: hypothetical protein VET90_06410, partial [Candidatus Binatus sp.]|nr:hypothetical protein [Candidatus Binatus sp.]
MTEHPTGPEATPSPRPARAVPRRAAAVAGAVAVGVALALGELSAGLAGGPSPLVAVGQVVVDYQPPGAKDLVIGLFGTNDKLALQVFVAIVALAIGCGLGILGRARPTAASLVIGAFAAAGLLAQLRDPESSLPVAVVIAGP